MNQVYFHFYIKMEIPVEVIRDHIIPYCDVKTILTLSETCKSYERINQWFYLVKRDYKIKFEISERSFLKYSRNIYKHLHKITKNGKNTSNTFFYRGDEENSNILKLKYPEITTFVKFGDSSYPTADKMMDILWKDSKLEKTCSSTKSCRCYDCMLAKIKKITKEK